MSEGIFGPWPSPQSMVNHPALQTVYLSFVQGGCSNESTHFVSHDVFPNQMDLENPQIHQIHWAAKASLLSWTTARNLVVLFCRRSYTIIYMSYIGIRWYSVLGGAILLPLLRAYYGPITNGNPYQTTSPLRPGECLCPTSACRWQSASSAHRGAALGAGVRGAAWRVNFAWGMFPFHESFGQTCLGTWWIVWMCVFYGTSWNIYIYYIYIHIWHYEYVDDWC